MVLGDVLRLWNVHKEMFDATVADLLQLAGGTPGDPYALRQLLPTSRKY